MNDLTGRKFGNLLVVGLEVGKHKCGGKWKCLCVCGGKLSLPASRLLRGSFKSCGCRHFQKRDDNPKWIGHELISGSFMYRIKRDAKRRGFLFEVDAKYLWNLFQNQNEICALSGVAIDLPSTREDERSYNYTASVDRIDSNKGYVVGNIQWIHKEVNCMKWDKQDSDFIAWCEKIVAHSKG